MSASKCLAMTKPSQPEYGCRLAKLMTYYIFNHICICIYFREEMERRCDEVTLFKDTDAYKQFDKGYPKQRYGI